MFEHGTGTEYAKDPKGQPCFAGHSTFWFSKRKYFFAFQKSFFTKIFGVWKKVGPVSRCENLWRTYFSHSWLDLTSVSQLNDSNPEQRKSENVDLSNNYNDTHWKNLIRLFIFKSIFSSKKVSWTFSRTTRLM